MSDAVDAICNAIYLSGKSIRFLLVIAFTVVNAASGLNGYCDANTRCGTSLVCTTGNKCKWEVGASCVKAEPSNCAKGSCQNGKCKLVGFKDFCAKSADCANGYPCVEGKCDWFKLGDECSENPAFCPYFGCYTYTDGKKRCIAIATPEDQIGTCRKQYMVCIPGYSCDYSSRKCVLL